MKHLLSILFVILSINIVTAKGGGGGGHSSGSHSSSHSEGGHGESGHTTTHHVSEGTHSSVAKTTRSYTHVTHIEPSEIHTYSRPLGCIGGSNDFIYYYLLFNHNTNTNDTIQSNSQEDLQAQVSEITDEDDTPMSVGSVAIGILVFCVVVFIIGYLVVKYA